MFSKASKTSNLKTSASSASDFIPDKIRSEIFNGAVEGDHVMTDCRRLLDDRLGERELRREMREFDFDLQD